MFYHNILNIVPCALQEVLVVYLYYTLVYLLIPNFLIPLHLSHLIIIRVFSKSVSLILFYKYVHLYY